MQRRNSLRGCSGKISFPTKGAARDAAMRVKAKGRSKYGTAVYFCQWCSGFHWGNDVKSFGRPKPPPPEISFNCEDI